MPKQIIIAEQHQIAAVFWEDQIQEIVVSTGAQQVGDIYLGVVENVIPGIDAAFINIGDSEKNGFIHVSDLGPIRLRKNSSSITELLEPQQKALVQVMKEPTGNKGPRLTGNITMPGRYVVLMPYGKGVNLSRRISNDNERSRLRALAVLMKPPGMGLLVRTEAEGTDEDSIIEDLESLQKQWESIQQQANYGRPPMLINRDDDFIQRVLRDIYSDEVNRIVVDSSSGVKRVKNQLMNWQGGKTPDGLLIDHHREKQNILEYFRVNGAIREALKPRVDLPSGGYIIMEPTEALTVIDVNSGSFTKSATARETVLWTNFEAATEIARQLRLRNIGGVIVVDFIDMDSRRDQLKLLEHFTRILKADKARPQIAQLSELGLVELTRKRQGKNLYELFGTPCSHCNGLGHLAHLPGEEHPSGLQIGNILPVSTQSSSTDGRPTLTNRTVSSGNNGRNDSRSKSSSAANESLDLLNHPDYQEQNNSGNRRRRRRSPEVSAKPVLRDPNEKDTESPENEIKSVSKSKESKDNNSNGSNGNSSKNGNSGRYDRRGRYRREEIKYETVQVEMTPEEQNVYALIGVSPLVKITGGDEKDPRSTIVKVVRPGEAVEIPVEESSVATATLVKAEPEVSETSVPVESESEPKDADTEPQVVDKPTVKEISKLVSESDAKNENVTSAPEAVVEEKSVESEPESEPEQKIVRRRRRRRSSASE
ncbi:ribonuclease, Rne/Rng family [[Leptolyngbya] sp. PCC 7376]|uniref:Rne/Rng family ribonuclease n=1 Tax=[Leptolyngbya] sp. PCC 7376 TaxID=111781 RepID=UPI00029EDC54|nr:Rne/Rng family ribonuclease [[Leptolyngbya] sp. PCC 7376]AFY37850.1 ribonuclease, Rne/Rng family [[Leptolyngbya] sp. PCC 7376]